MLFKAITIHFENHAVRHTLKIFLEATNQQYFKASLRVAMGNARIDFPDDMWSNVCKRDM